MDGSIMDMSEKPEGGEALIKVSTVCSASIRVTS